MIDQWFFQYLAMQGEPFRVLIAMLGTGAATWYDLTNNKNVPDKLLYAFLGCAFLVNIVFFQQDVFIYALTIAALMFIPGYLLYRFGYIGGADVYVLTAIALALPVFPSNIAIIANVPLVLSVIIYSGVLFSIYFLSFVLFRVIFKGAKGKMEYMLVIPPYAIMLYFLYTTGFFSPAYLVILALLVIASVLFMVYKEAMMKEMSERIPISKVEPEDIASLELMQKDVKKYSIKRLLDEKEIARLKKAGLKTITVYTKLPPFLPFVLAALAIAILLGDLFTNMFQVI
ncbi:hypothetical protein KJ780_03420 [Candidatus Micrarchaeota archaeon]|nr:hypothetical protein [Candidatus Micrarchaeota archaeon]